MLFISKNRQTSILKPYSIVKAVLDLRILRIDCHGNFCEGCQCTKLIANYETLVRQDVYRSLNALKHLQGWLKTPSITTVQLRKRK